MRDISLGTFLLRVSSGTDFDPDNQRHSAYDTRTYMFTDWVPAFQEIEAFDTETHLEGRMVDVNLPFVGL